jgi:hypothetical protein
MRADMALCRNAAAANSVLLRYLATTTHASVGRKSSRQVLKISFVGSFGRCQGQTIATNHQQVAGLVFGW